MTDIQKEINELKTKLGELEKRLAEKSLLRHKPEIREGYFYVNDLGYITKSRWDNDDLDNYRFNTGNCFRTKEQAKTYKLKLETIGKLWSMTDFVPDWKDVEQDKFFVYYNNEEELFRANCCWFYEYSPFGMYFRTREDADCALASLTSTEIAALEFNEYRQV